MEAIEAIRTRRSTRSYKDTLLFFLRLRMAAFCVWALSGVLFFVLIVLLIIESHQDKVLNDIAIKENKEKGGL